MREFDRRGQAAVLETDPGRAQAGPEEPDRVTRRPRDRSGGRDDPEILKLLEPAVAGDDRDAEALAQPKGSPLAVVSRPQDLQRIGIEHGPDHGECSV